MRVLVYPHTLEIGGSQLNAVEIGAAVRDRGHDVAVYGEEGPLLTHIEQLGLPFIPARHGRRSPSLAVAHDLRSHSTGGGFDVIHGYEWPPVLEAYAAGAVRGGAATVGTVMSMSVAGFIPRDVPLVVGTEQIRRDAARTRGDLVSLIEPPVDVEANRPGAGDHERFRGRDGAFTIVVVCRLAEQLKLEGLLTAIRATAQLSETRDAHLWVVGDGPARAVVEAEAQRANASAGRTVVTLTGSLADPRGAYAAADVCIGMGGSALRALAFAKPLVVQGEGGFFSLLTPQTLPMFLDQGWYGLGDLDQRAAAADLVHTLDQLAGDAQARERLGDFGRRVVVDRFSLEAAAATQERIYRDAVARGSSAAERLSAGLRSAGGLAVYKVRRRAARIRKVAATDDFNARSR